MQLHDRLHWVFGILLLMLISVSASGQVVPDTVYRKPSLPTGPPGEVPQQQPRARPQQPQPRPVPEPVQPPVVTETPDTPEFEEQVPLIDKLYFGGGLGLQFGTFTSISLAPILGVMVTEKFWTGGGIMYDYLGSRNVSLQNYGVKAYAQYEVIESVVLHAEYDLLSVQNFRNSYTDKFRKMIGIPLAGVGYRQRIGSRASSDILVLYNFNTEGYSLYSNPVIRVSLNIPFRNF